MRDQRDPAATSHRSDRLISADHSLPVRVPPSREGGYMQFAGFVSEDAPDLRLSWTPESGRFRSISFGLDPQSSLEGAGMVSPAGDRRSRRRVAGQRLGQLPAVAKPGRPRRPSQPARAGRRDSNRDRAGAALAAARLVDRARTGCGTYCCGKRCARRRAETCRRTQRCSAGWSSAPTSS